MVLLRSISCLMVLYFQVDEDGSMVPFSKETDVVGLKISTKAKGSNRRDDITDEYKHPEGW